MSADPPPRRPGLGRLASSAGMYAVAGFAQQALGFLFIPIYTRLIDPTEYGSLEVLNVFSTVAFACLTMGLASAINKCQHRDCDGPSERATVLATAVALDLPILVAAAIALTLLADPISRLLVGSPDTAGLIPIVAGAVLSYSVATLVLAAVRSEERALAYGLLSLTQFALSLILNLTLVVYFRAGIRGILWSNLLSNAALIPLAMLALRRSNTLTFNRRLVKPLIGFGLLVAPMMLAGWVMDASDRYILRLYRGLDEVAAYGVGYKLGMIVQFAVVWPFQLAWPAFSFAISQDSGHRETYARALTYLTAIVVTLVLAISLLGRAGLPILLGPGYGSAEQVVPLIAAAYALNGLQFCLSPGIHIAGRTRVLTLLAMGAAGLNVAASLVLIPPFGMMGAAWATALTFLALTLATGLVARRVYPVDYEYRRLLTLIGSGALVYFTATRIHPHSLGLSLAWHASMPLAVFPLVVVALGFFDARERSFLRQSMRRWAPPVPQ